MTEEPTLPSDEPRWAAFLAIDWADANWWMIKRASQTA
jgi:hypothetical protein